MTQVKKSELRHLFTTKLKSKLEGLEKERHDVMITTIWAAIGGITAFVGYLGFKFDTFSGWPFIIGGLILALWKGLEAHKKFGAYKDRYKEDIVREIFRLVDPDLTYIPHNRIPSADYHQSELFLKGVDRYQGDDYCQGVIGKTAFEFSELHTEYKTTTTDSKGRTRTQWHTIFRGIFFHADFNKYIKSKTFVLPDTAESILGSWLGQFFQSKNFSRDQLVKMEDVTFEKRFVVYSDDQIDARYILTPNMMTRIIELQEKVGNQIFLAFKGNRVYIAVSYGRNNFEPRLFSSGVAYQDVETIHTLLTNTLAIVEDLNLNTRIWTKS